MAFQRGPNIVTNGLVLALDAGNTKSYINGSTIWYDRSGNNLTGSLINGPIFNNTNGGYISCDGVNDYIEIPDNNLLDFGSGSFTIEYWFRKIENTSGFSNIWGPNKWNTGATSGTNEWSLGIGNGTSGTGNNYAFAVEVGTSAYFTGESLETLELNKWYQIVAQREGANLKIYLNSILKTNVTPSGFTTTSIVNNVGRNLRINNSALNNYYTKADNAILRIYNRALSAQEIQQNYNALKSRYNPE